MNTWDGDSHYFSGQGVVLVGERDVLGRPKGLFSVGNVSDLKITLATSVIEHKESQTGQRGIDMRLTTELKSGLAITMESVNKENLAMALRGSYTQKVAAAVTSEAPKNYWGRVVPLKWAKVSGLVVHRPGPVTLVPFVTPGTPFDYYINPDAGSLKMNDGKSTDGLMAASSTTGGVSITGTVGVGYPTVLTVENSAAANDYAAVNGLTGADAALVNGMAHRIVSRNATTISIDLDTTGKTITFGTGLVAFDGEALSVDYSYAGQNLVDALNVGSQERFMRFEGLNTADGNLPCVVEVFRFLIDPMKELDLISDTLQKFVLDGSALADPLQLTGSKYFRVILLR